MRPPHHEAHVVHRLVERLSPRGTYRIGVSAQLLRVRGP